MPATIVGFDGSLLMGPHFSFLSLGRQLPASQWSDGLWKMLNLIPGKYFILMLEDYWLYQLANPQQINDLVGLMDDEILRIDLSGNRTSYKAAYEVAPGIVETPPGTPYQMSFQAAIWHRENLRSVLKSGENPWESEINGSKRVGNLRVLGTKLAALYYQPVWRSKQKRWQLDKIGTEDLEYMRGRGWLDENLPSY